MAEHVRRRVRSFAGASVGSVAADANIVEEPSVDAQIVGGELAPPGLHPFLVGLLQASTSTDYNAQFCAGTLINENTVVTAAHCCDFQSSLSQIAVLVGVSSVGGGDSGKRVGPVQWLYCSVRLSNTHHCLHTHTITCTDANPVDDHHKSGNTDQCGEQNHQSPLELQHIRLRRGHPQARHGGYGHPLRLARPARLGPG